jgi:hypothetical protein
MILYRDLLYGNPEVVFEVGAVELIIDDFLMVWKKL